MCFGQDMFGPPCKRWAKTRHYLGTWQLRMWAGVSGPCVCTRDSLGNSNPDRPAVVLGQACRLVFSYPESFRRPITATSEPVACTWAATSRRIARQRLRLPGVLRSGPECPFLEFHRTFHDAEVSATSQFLRHCSAPRLRKDGIRRSGSHNSVF